RGVWKVLNIIPILKFQALKEVQKSKSQSAQGRCLNAVANCSLELGISLGFGVWCLELVKSRVAPLFRICYDLRLCNTLKAARWTRTATRSCANSCAANFAFPSPAPSRS